MFGARGCPTLTAADVMMTSAADVSQRHASELRLNRRLIATRLADEQLLVGGHAQLDEVRWSRQGDVRRVDEAAVGWLRIDDEQCCDPTVQAAGSGG